jgi:predicted phosphodiesterase
MKLAVLSDIHGNLEALQAVLEAVHHENPDAVISLGDNIGYGPDSQAVVELIREQRMSSVMGNHEMALKRKGARSWFNPMAQKALDIASSQLSDAATAWVKGLPHWMKVAGLRFVHGVPPASMFVYLFQVPERKLIHKFNRLPESICFVGHTHDLGITAWDGHRLHREKPAPGCRTLDPNRQYIINAGSVGQPRDGIFGAKFLLYDTDTRCLTVRVTDYPFEKTQKKILAAGIPRMYAERLAIGKAPSGSNGNKE